MRARYYSPVNGRFTTVDPIRDGTNWYAYCGNSLVVFVDPWGLMLTSSEEDSEFFLNAINQITDDEIRYDPETKSYYVYKMYDTERHVGQTLVQDLIASEEVIVLQTTSDGLSYYEIESKTLECA